MNLQREQQQESVHSMRLKTNLLSGIIFVIFGGILLLFIPSQIEVSDSIPFVESARVAPFFAIMVMILGGITLIFQSLVLKRENIIEIHFAQQKNALFIIAVILLYALLIYLIGYIIASVITVGILYFFFKLKSWLHLGMTLGIAIGIYFLFSKIFNVSLPGIGGVLF